MKAPVSTALAILVGLLVLLGYVIPIPFLANLRSILLGWAVVLVGFATLVGVVNLLATNWRKATASNERDWYSWILLIAFVATLAAGIILGTASHDFQQLILAIQVPVESSLMALLAIILAYASLRLLQRRQGTLGILFVLSAIVFLILGSGLLSGLQLGGPIQELVNFLNRLPAAGARGILLGIALGSLTAGLRILLGADRPYRG